MNALNDFLLSPELHVVSSRETPSKQKVNSLKGIRWNGAWQADLPSSAFCSSNTNAHTDSSISHYRIWLHPVASWQAVQESVLREMRMSDPMLQRNFGTGECRGCQKLPRHLDAQIASINTTLLPQEAQGTKNNETQVSI